MTKNQLTLEQIKQTTAENKKKIAEMVAASGIGTSLHELFSFCDEMNEDFLPQINFDLEVTPAGVFFRDKRKNPPIRINPVGFIDKKSLKQFIGRWILRRLMELNRVFKSKSF